MYKSVFTAVSLNPQLHPAVKTAALVTIPLPHWDCLHNQVMQCVLSLFIHGTSTYVFEVTYEVFWLLLPAALYALKKYKVFSFVYTTISVTF